MNRVFINRLTVLFAFVSGLAMALPAQGENLSDALANAYRHSDLLNQNRALLRSADEDVLIAYSALRPVITYTARSRLVYARSGLNTNSSNHSVNVDLRWLIWDYGSTKAQIEAQKLTVLATRQSLIDIEQRVLLGGVQAYMQYRQAADVLALRSSNVRLIRQELQAANDRFDVGEITRTDVAFAQSRLASAQAAEVSAQGTLAEAREGYKVATGHYPSGVMNPPKLPVTVSSAEQARAIAVRNHPEVIAAQHAVAIAELGIVQAEASMMPRFTVGAGTTKASNATTSNTLDVTMTGTLYKGGELSARYNKAKLNVEAKRYALNIAVLNVGQSAVNAYNNLQVQRAQIESASQQIRASTVAYRGVKEEATLGSRTTLDVLDAEQELLDSRTNLLVSETQQYVAAYSLMASMGVLTVKKLGLNVVTYDPNDYYNSVKSRKPISVQGTQLDRVLKRLQKN
ncbi:MAG: TolC family outer membrane protein [Paracoccaceae bacterium]|nr:TolC family outer membrane protein [Paracoccaceae bacterium]